MKDGLKACKGKSESVQMVQVLMRASIALITEEKERNAHEIYGLACQHLHREMDSFVALMVKLQKKEMEDMEEFEKKAKEAKK